MNHSDESKHRFISAFEIVLTYEKIYHYMTKNNNKKKTKNVAFTAIDILQKRGHSLGAKWYALSIDASIFYSHFFTGHRPTVEKSGSANN